jgi:acetyl-CoA C-acetyltransferase
MKSGNCKSLRFEGIPKILLCRYLIDGAMSDDSKPVYIAGAFEHPTREAPDKSTVQLHAEVAQGALKDASISKNEVDGYFTANIPEFKYGKTPQIMADYLNLDVTYVDTTEAGGSSYIGHLGHATSAIRQGHCDIALITLAGRPRSRDQDTGTGVRSINTTQDSFERIYGSSVINMYAMAAQRHMHEFGTTSEQLAEVRVAASHHAQYNENALYKEPVSIEDVIDSKIVADPLHLLDCCVITDGGGSIVVVSEEQKDRLERECVEVLSFGETVKHHRAGQVDLTHTGAKESGTKAFDRSEIDRSDIDYASIYDSFTITVLETIEDLGFCEKGNGGDFVEDGALKAPDGVLPFNTDGGGLCSNHPGNRGGMTKIIEAVRQLRGEANPEVQVDADYALAHGTGGGGINRHHAATAILGSDQR